MKEVVDDITENDLRIMQYIADKLKRSEAKECKGHSSWFACEYCYAKGIKIDISESASAKSKIANQIALLDEKINQCQSEEINQENTLKIENYQSLKNELQKTSNSLKRKSNILWPQSTMYAQNRTRKTHLDIIRKIESGQVLSHDESKGVTGRFILLDIPTFNFVYDTPAEYLHSGCLGLTKRLVELTFDCGNKRQRVTKRKLSSTAKFNKLMLSIKVVKEFGRRARNLDFAVFKGQEFRNLSLFFFPVIIECIEPEAKEITLWLYLAYMFRSSTIPTSEYENISLPLVREICEKFYKAFEELFGPENCPYNIHVFVAHLLEIRTHGPLTETSAYKFESFYGEVRRSFVPGTNSPLKQVLKTILLKRAISKHVCENNIFISNYDTSMECNNLIYCYKRKEYFIYQVTNIDNDDITCNKVGMYPAQFKETPEIDWSTVGVFRKGGVSSQESVIQSSEIEGKVLNVGKYLITCPINVLHEK